MAGLVIRKAQILRTSILAILSMMASPVLAQNDPVSFTNTENMATTLTPKADGFEMSVQDARGVITRYGYNNSGQLQFLDNPKHGLITYSYDEFGRRSRIETEGKIVSQLTFDDQNRLIRQTWREGASDKVSTRYTYDTCDYGDGKLCRVAHNEHVMRYGYTVDGNLAFVKAKLADEEAIETVRYRYGDNGRVESMRYPSGLRVTYRYNENGRVSGLMGIYETGDDRERFIIIRAVRYDKTTGRVIAFTHGNGVKTRYSYDNLGRLSNIIRKLNGESIGEDVYGYNADGFINAIDRLNSADSRRYGYDSQGRLTYESHGDGTVEASTTVSYNYDAVGNRLSGTVDGRTRSYIYAPDANQLQSINQQEFIYDARGNLREDPSGRRSFEYDASNRMKAFYRNGELRAEYDYDANGRRIRKTLHSPDGEGVKSVRFFYDSDGRMISEISRREDRSAIKARDIVWIGPIAIAQVERSVLANGTTRKANVLSLHTDHLGAPRIAMNKDGATVWSWYGDAFGANIGSMPAINRDPDGDGNITEISLRFPGQYHDRESGNWYNHNRDYNAKLGRYIQSDPIGLSGGVNLYAYALGNPVSFTDPNGLSTLTENCYTTEIWSNGGWVPGSSMLHCEFTVEPGVDGLIDFSAPTSNGGNIIDFLSPDGNLMIFDPHCMALFGTTATTIPHAIAAVLPFTMAMIATGNNPSDFTYLLSVNGDFVPAATRGLGIGASGGIYLRGDFQEFGYFGSIENGAGIDIDVGVSAMIATTGDIDGLGGGIELGAGFIDAFLPLPPGAIQDRPMVFGIGASISPIQGGVNVSQLQVTGTKKCKILP